MMDEKKEWVLKPYIRTLTVILVLGGIALGAMAFSAQATSEESVFFTQDDDDPQPPFHSRDGMRGFPGFGHHGGGHFRAGPEYDTFLAEALGISLEELQDAYAAANSAALDQAVADGALTQEEADLIKARGALAETIDREALMAGALGISTSELESARETGTSLFDLMDELGLDPEEVGEAMRSAYEDAVQDAVSSGVITQDQADEILSERVGGFFFGGPRMFHRGGGDHGHGWRLMPKSESNQDTNL
jgi:hypothetical protein